METVTFISHGNNDLITWGQWAQSMMTLFLFHPMETLAFSPWRHWCYINEDTTNHHLLHNIPNLFVTAFKIMCINCMLDKERSCLSLKHVLVNKKKVMYNSNFTQVPSGVILFVFSTDVLVDAHFPSWDIWNPSMSSDGKMLKTTESNNDMILLSFLLAPVRDEIYVSWKTSTTWISVTHMRWIWSNRHHHRCISSLNTFGGRQLLNLFWAYLFSYNDCTLDDKGWLPQVFVSLVTCRVGVYRKEPSNCIFHLMSPSMGSVTGIVLQVHVHVMLENNS